MNVKSWIFSTEPASMAGIIITLPGIFSLLTPIFAIVKISATFPQRIIFSSSVYAIAFILAYARAKIRFSAFCWIIKKLINLVRFPAILTDQIDFPGRDSIFMPPFMMTFLVTKLMTPFFNPRWLSRNNLSTVIAVQYNFLVLVFISTIPTAKVILTILIDFGRYAKERVSTIIANTFDFFGGFIFAHPSIATFLAAKRMFVSFNPTRCSIDTLFAIVASKFYGQSIKKNPHQPKGRVCYPDTARLMGPDSIVTNIKAFYTLSGYPNYTIKGYK